MDLAYLGGFFDGEGCIGIYTNGQRTGWSLRIQVTQNENDFSTNFFSELQSRWGGSVCRQKTLSGRTKLNYQLSANLALRFLIDLEPYLRAKKDQALVGIEWQQGRSPQQRSRNGRILAAPFERKRSEIAATSLKAMKRAA